MSYLEVASKFCLEIILKIADTIPKLMKGIVVMEYRNLQENIYEEEFNDRAERNFELD